MTDPNRNHLPVAMSVCEVSELVVWLTEYHAI